MTAKKIGIRLPGTAYFVSESLGDDANSGLTGGTGGAWKTIAKVNGSTFAPNDTVRLKCGDAWREQLKPPSSGTAGHPIRFASYGVGDKPLILGSLDLTGAWTADAGADDTFTSVVDFAARTRTTASVAWNAIAHWTDGTRYNTPDLTSIVQEIVDLDDWVSGEGMVFFLADNASSASRQFAGFNGSSSSERPILTIVHTTNVTVTDLKPQQNSDTVTVWPANIAYTFSKIGNDGQSTREWGVRFDNVTVPKNVTIVSASISLKAVGNSASDTCNVTVRGEATVHPFREAIADIWQATVSCPLEIGNLIFDNEDSVGTLASSLAGCTSQGDFYWQEPMLYLYSASDPGTFYSHIEAAQNIYGVHVYHAGDPLSYLTFKNLDLVFNMTAGDDVAGWEGFTALTGGTGRGIIALTPVTFSNDGTYTLTGASTGFNLVAAADA